MKKILLLILCGFALASSAQVNTESKSAELKWYDWNEGYELAVKSGKILLVDAYTDWCGWCKRMDRDTYSKSEVISKVNESFIPVKFNPELTGRTYFIGKDTLTAETLYGMLTQGRNTGFPTVYYIMPAKRKIMLDPGYKDPQAFLQVLDQIIEESKK